MGLRAGAVDGAGEGSGGVEGDSSVMTAVYRTPPKENKPQSRSKMAEIGTQKLRCRSLLAGITTPEAPISEQNGGDAHPKGYDVGAKSRRSPPPRHPYRSFLAEITTRRGSINHLQASKTHPIALQALSYRSISDQLGGYMSSQRRCCSRRVGGVYLILRCSARTIRFFVLFPPPLLLSLWGICLTLATLSGLHY